MNRLPHYDMELADMPVVKKMGSVDGIMPSLDELRSIQRIKALAAIIIPRNIVYPYSTHPLYKDGNWAELQRKWGQIRYYRQSKTLSNTLHTIAKECIFKSGMNDTDFARWYDNQILKVWGSQFDSPQVLFDNIQEAIRMSDDEPVRLTFLSSTSCP